jgi:hypothetical protein
VPAGSLPFGRSLSSPVEERGPSSAGHFGILARSREGTRPFRVSLRAVWRYHPGRWGWILVWPEAVKEPVLRSVTALKVRVDKIATGIFRLAPRAETAGFLEPF